MKRSDVFTKAKRSEVMSRIRGKGNKDTEVALARLFRANGITGWRRHYGIAGKPDFAFPEHKLAVFVDGCFWHACPKHATQPKGNRKFWLAKLEANRKKPKTKSKWQERLEQMQESQKKIQEVKNKQAKK